MTTASSRRANRRSRRKEVAQRKARRRKRQHLGLRIVTLVLVVLFAGLGLFWVFAQTDDSGTASNSGDQALHQFETADFHSLAFGLTESDTLYFGYHEGLKVSYDGGLTWEDGALSGVDAMQQVIPVAAPERHYVAGHDVFQVSTDGGQTWQAQPNDLPGLDIHGFAAAPSDPGQLYAFEATSSGFYTSTDGGQTWKSLPLPPGMQSANLPLAVAYDDPLHLYAGVGEQILESRDGGQSWQTLPGPGGVVLGIATDPRDPAVFLVGTVEDLWRHAADGSWQKLIAPEGAIMALALHPQQPDRIAIVDEQGNFYRSDDGGTTWNPE